jgi:multidrug transporter EmrE-like cation transporter
MRAQGLAMNNGLIFCFLGTLSFGLLGCASKFAERKNCQASVLVVFLFGWATLVMLVRSAGLRSPLSLPLRAVVLAVACGICAAVAYYAFQYSIGFGKVSVAWLMMNISSATPAVVSVFVYGEKLTLLKVLALGLVLVSLYFIFRGRRAEAQAGTLPLPGQKQAKWFLLMLVILLTNGMSAYGLKVIAAWGLPETAKFPYLTVWYAAGLVIIGVPTLLQGVRITVREVGWSSILAALSLGGQLAMAVALKLNVPGHVVFPIAIGGSVFIVVLGGRLFFNERMNALTAGGVSCGLAAVVFLSFS